MAPQRVGGLDTLTEQHITGLSTIPAACCSTDLIGTKRMVGRDTASQIASASAASVLLRLT